MAAIPLHSQCNNPIWVRQVMDIAFLQQPVARLHWPDNTKRRTRLAGLGLLDRVRMATTNVSEAPSSGGLFSLVRAASRPSLLALAIAPLAVISGFAAYAILAHLGPNRPLPNGLIALLVLNITLDVTLGGLIVWRLARLWTEWRRQRTGARLHVRLVGMFIAIVVVPAILVAVFAAVSRNLGMTAWF